MAVNFITPGIHHICLRCSDMVRTKNFYEQTLGFKLVLENAELMAFLAGPFILVFKKANAEPGKDVFSPFNIGLDHIALTCATEEELHRAAKELAVAGVENTGVKLDETLQKLYVAFKDPDRIQWEFYMA